MINLAAKKIGMSHIYSEDGTMTPVTIVKLYESCVINLIQNNDKDFNNIIIAYDKSQTKKVSKPLAGVFLKNNLPVYKRVYGCRLSKDINYNIGDSIDAFSFLKDGTSISVTGNSVGKGFAGVMKRHNFSGLEASHGVSVAHRSHGSTGQRQDPGKVFKGKKMAGHMGNTKVTIKNLKLVFIDKENSIIAVKGAIPGSSNSDIILKVS